MSRFLRTISRISAPLARPFAGRRRITIWAIVEHRGRRSGRLYRTPVAIVRSADAFVIPMPFGDSTQWARNVLAAGGCRVRWNGRPIDVVSPLVMGREEGAAAFNRLERRLLGLARIDQFLQVKVSPEPHPGPEGSGV